MKNNDRMSMQTDDASVDRLLKRIDQSWNELQDALNGLTETELSQPHTMNEWSIRDILAHITTWEEQALEHLPTIMSGGRPPKYVTYGGIDAFNAEMTEKKRNLPLEEVKRQMSETHGRLLALIRTSPPEHFKSQSRALRRLRWDTHGHYAEHAQAIRAWRDGQLPSEEQPSEAA